MKYEFTGEIRVESGVTLRRIRRIEDGLIGGWIEKESNLSQDGSCFVFDDARVFGQARVYDDAWVYGQAQVFGQAWVSGDAQVFGQAQVYDDAQVSGRAQVSGEAQVFGQAWVSGNAWVYYSELTTNFHEDTKTALRCSLNVVPVNNRIILFKRVNRIDDTRYASLYDPEFVYTIGEFIEVDANPDKMISCGSGLHLSHKDYWNKGDSLIECEVDIDDIICVLEGKVRCSKLKVIGLVEKNK
jgi:hypothetical protein